MDATSDGLSFGPFHLDLARGELLNAGELVPLAPKPLALLGYLAIHRDRAVPKPELRKHVWPDVHVSEAALASALKDLRRALGDDGASQKVIRTMRRRGYRFVAKLEAGGAEQSRVTPRRHTPVRARATPFIARGRELRSLASWTAQAARGRPRIVLIRGEAGAGKTRLLEQLLAHPVCSGFATAIGRCSADESLPYLPFAEAIRARLTDGDEPAERALGDDAPLLRPFLQLEPARARSSAELADLNPLRERADLFAAVTGLLERIARRRPTLLALEDLHGADSASLELLEHLVAALGAANEPLPLLLIATARASETDERLEWVLRALAASPVCATLRLTGFGVAATGRIIDGLGVARPAQMSLQQIHELTDGNPLFVRELVRGERAAGLMTRDAHRGERYRAEPPARSHGLRRAIAARLATLSPEARDLLTAAAFLGERFGLLALTAVTRRGEESALAGLAEAERADVVTREGRSFRFDHPLFREVIRDATDERARRELHRDVAAVLEDLYATAPGEHAMEIARHLREAGELVAPARLLEYARRAGAQASALCAWREAAYFHEAALGAAESLPPAERGELLVAAGLAANHDYDAERSLRHYARAVDAFAEAGDDLGLARSLMLLTRARFTFPSAPAGAKVDVRPLEELGARLGESQPALRALLLGTISEAHWVVGDVELAKQAAERAVAIGVRHDDSVVSHHAYLGLGLAQLSQLQMREALDSWLEAAAHARRTRDPWREAAPGPRITLALLHLGRLDEARERGRAAVELARRAHDTGELGFACAHLASLEGVTGRFDDSEQHARASLDSLDRAGNAWAGALALSARACTAAHRGDWANAKGALDALVSPEHGKPGALVEFIAATYREVVAARSARAELDPRRVASLVGALRSARLDPYLVGALCGLAEVSDALGDADLAVTPEAMLRHAFEHGVVFSSGWGYLVPRMLARCAALGRRWDEAETLFERAIALARASGAHAELALSLLDRASASRSPSARELDEAIASFEALGMRPALRDALEFRESLA